MSSNHGTSQQDHNRSRIQNYDKFHKYALSFHDQVYLIFLEHGVRTLHFEKIRNGLLHRFGTANVLIGDVSRLRFLYQFEGGGIFTLYLKSDDICPLGFNCKKDNSSCQRLHTFIREHLCAHISISTMLCQNRDCHLIHFIRPRVRDSILAVILWIFKRHKHQNPALEFRDLVISGEEFVGSYSKLYPKGPPIPNMNTPRWKRVVHRYSKYHIDYQQQRQGVDGRHHGNKPFITIWRTESVDGGWCIRMLRGYGFIVRRMCNKWMDSGFECRFCPLSFCPYFHLHQHCVAIERDPADFSQKDQWIFPKFQQEKV